MTLKEMLEYINDAAPEPFLSDEDRKKKISSTVKKIAAGMKRRGHFQLSPPLPDLYTSGTVSTVLSADRASLPENFGRDVRKVLIDGEPVTLFKSLSLFRDKFPYQEAGPVVGACEFGKKLVYGDIPETETEMTVFYYAKPEDLEDDDDEPDYIPEELHEDLICGEVCRSIYSVTEGGGIDDHKPNTLYYADLVDKALETLELIIGRDEGAFNVSDSGDYIN